MEFVFRSICQAKSKQFCVAEAQHWKRRAKVKWCKLGDENSKFFHTMATYRFRKNKIGFLAHNGNEFFRDQHKLKIATDYFADIFSETRTWSPNILLTTLYDSQSEQLQSLTSQFTWEEIHSAIQKMPSNKSPGPDGFTNEFYKFYLQDLKPDLLALFRAWHDQTVNLSGVNLAYIALLPKREDPQEIKDYRPISLQHSIPKLIAKVMANRLQPKINTLVDSMQTGFIKDLSIVENFAAAIEMIQSGNKMKKPIIVLKLDFQKAFDTIHWEAIFHTMSARGFPPKWIGWVRELLKTSQAQMIINGHCGSKFKIQRGVRQGDPLSPYIFILVADILQQMFRKAYESGFLRHPIQQGSPYPALQCAVDTLLNIQGSAQQALLAKQLLCAFSEFTGLQINYQKSTFVPMHMSEMESNVAASVMGCTLPCTYLGLPLSANKISKQLLQPVINKIQKRLSGWMPRLMSSGGRIQMINSVLSAIPNFFMACIEWDQGSIEAVDKLRRAFLWKNKEKILGGQCLVSWSIVTMPKKQGGLGIRDLRIHNKAIMANFTSKLLPNGSSPCFSWLAN
jgi:hypothetical protein